LGRKPGQGRQNYIASSIIQQSICIKIAAIVQHLSKILS
jgi:hypothetical protein